MDKAQQLRKELQVQAEAYRALQQGERLEYIPLQKQESAAGAFVIFCEWVYARWTLGCDLIAPLTLNVQPSKAFTARGSS